jgi:flavin-dependent dehydrogenase
VLLLERGRFPRHKVCGEFVSAESLELLASLLDTQHAHLLGEAVRIPAARLFIDGQVLQTAIDPPAASIARLDLDAALWTSAVGAGVKTQDQTTVQNIAEAGLFRVATSAGQFESRAVVNATGRWSNLNAAPAASGRLPQRWLGLKAHFAEKDATGSVDLYFFEGGYCGVQPVELCGTEAGGGRVNACAMVRADVASTLPAVFAQHPVLQERSRGWHPLSEPISTSPLLFGAPQPVHEDVVMAGDAAGFVDPFVGDGISLALRSGALAAECLVPFFRGEMDLPDAARQYRQAYQQRLAPIFHASSRIRRMMGLPRVVRKSLLQILDKTPSITRYVVSKTR